MKSITEIGTFCDHPQVRLVDRNHTPSWKAFGKGFAEFRAYGAIGKGQLSISLHEGWEKSSRQTMMTLDRQQIEALRNLCNQALGE